jgi:tRNA A37 threonylcarbamoyltransferase TsaD
VSQGWRFVNHFIQRHPGLRATAAQGMRREWVHSNSDTVDKSNHAMIKTASSIQEAVKQVLSRKVQEAIRSYCHGPLFIGGYDCTYG